MAAQLATGWRGSSGGHVALPTYGQEEGLGYAQPRKKGHENKLEVSRANRAVEASWSGSVSPSSQGQCREKACGE